MPVTRTADAPFADAVEGLARSGPAPLADRRRSALAAYLEAPLPPRAQHLWRYTDPARLLPEGMRPAGGVGIHDTGPLQDGVRVAALAPALAEGPVAERFASLSGEASGKFEGLNLALFPSGILVEVAPGARPGNPISIAHGEAAPEGDGGAAGLACPRLLVTVGEGAEACVVEQFGADGWTPDLVHAVTEVFLAPGARLVHVVLNEFGGRSRANLVQRARLEGGASLTSIGVSFGGSVVKTEASAVLAGPDARSEVLGALFATGRQHLDAHYFQDHRAPRTRSDLLVRTALAGRARASYTGRLRIALDAPGCEARQENRNLLLSGDARADSIPELEILTHEVQCAHAAATGPVDPEMLFYLRSRGLDRAEAERAIVLGFLEPVFARMPGAPMPGGGLAEEMRAVAARRLGGASGGPGAGAAAAGTAGEAGR